MEKGKKVENLEEVLKQFTEQIKDKNLKDIPKEEFEKLKESLSVAAEKIEVSPGTSKLDVNIETSAFQQKFHKNDILPSRGYFFKVPEQIEIKLELLGEDLEAISKFSERFSPKDLLISRYSTNEIIVRFSEIQSFIIKKFTNLDPDSLTIQDKIHINTVIGMNNLIIKMLDLKCPVEDHTFQIPISDINTLEFRYLDEKEVEKFAQKYDFDIIFTEDRTLFRYKNYADPKLDFEILRSSFMPVILSPSSILDTLSFSLVRINEQFSNFQANKEILKKFPLKHLQKIFVFIIGMSLGLLEDFYYGYNIGKELIFTCPEHNAEVKLTLIEFLSNFFILF